MKKAKQGAVPVPKKNLWKQIAKHWEFYVLLLPGIILTIIFKYVYLVLNLYGFLLFCAVKNGICNYYINHFILVKFYSKLNIAESLVLIGNEHLL